MAAKPPTKEQHAHANRITHRTAKGKFASPPATKAKYAQGLIAPKDPTRTGGSRSKTSILDTPVQDVIDEIDESDLIDVEPTGEGV